MARCFRLVEINVVLISSTALYSLADLCAGRSVKPELAWQCICIVAAQQRQVFRGLRVDLSQGERSPSLAGRVRAMKEGLAVNTISHS